MSKIADQSFLFDLLSTPSPTGFEFRGQKKWVDHLKNYADTVSTDSYGTAWATIAGAKPGHTIMLEAHADEIGYITKYIADDGFIYVDRIGGSDAATARGRTVHILTAKGVVVGIIGNTAIHIRDWREEKSPKVHELFIDVGAQSKEDVEAMGIRVGLPVVYASEPQIIGETLLSARALDNRIGGYILAQVAKKLRQNVQKLHGTVHCVNAVQEEVGGHGATMITSRLKPTIAICIDLTHATDTPTVNKAQFGDIHLHSGPVITHGISKHPDLVDHIIHTAKKHSIPHQHQASYSYGGTDADQIFKVADGLPTALITIPLRYMHSAHEVSSIADINLTIDLLYHVVLSLQNTDVFTLSLL